MNEAATLPWLVIRQEADGSRYRVGRCATRVEAQRLADRLGSPRSGARPAGPDPKAGDGGAGDTARAATGAQRYLVERLDQPGETPSGAHG
ncbi:MULTISPECIES: hypothetical protein [Streptomyces]|uniref:hypothetical protein n=1 Tax=Streptomyces TaxID=1883 RepID=UPI0022492348|nr:hypothetical protein [Streptomyces sp. JHD 1]MCX2971789.1 hypothetical protein [Streptomyces sp. JHD 1]